MQINILRSSLALLLFSIFVFTLAIPMAEPDPTASSLSSSSSKAEVHIIYTQKPDTDEPEAFHLRTLASVLGSEQAAKESLVYVYKNAATGFSAKLTPEQVTELSKQPGVLQIVPNMKLQLHSGTSRLH